MNDDGIVDANADCYRCGLVRIILFEKMIRCFEMKKAEDARRSFNVFVV